MDGCAAHQGEPGSLVRGNAGLFKKFVGVLTYGIGQRFVEGMDVPVLE